MIKRAFCVVALGALALVPTLVPASTGAAAPASESPVADIVAHAAAAGRGGGGSPGPSAAEIDAEAVLPLTTTADDGSTGSLRYAVETLAVNAGGDTIVLEAGATYVLTCAAGGSLEHGNTPLTFEGNGATMRMEAACEERILENGTGALEFRNVNFTGLDINDIVGIDGAIAVTNGSLTVLGGVVAYNTATNVGQRLDGWFDVAGAVVIDGTVFAFNSMTSPDNCGIVCSNTTVVVRNAQVYDTTLSGGGVGGASNCGGITCTGGDVDIIDSVVANLSSINAAGGCGGIACLDGTMRITRSKITNVTMNGTTNGVCGGLACAEDDFEVTDSSITGIFVSDGSGDICGGIACLDGSFIAIRSTIAGARIVLTGADDGACGSLICIDGFVRMTNTTFADNVTNGGGYIDAAIEADGAGAGYPVTLLYSTVVGNTGAGLPLFAPFQHETIGLQSFGSVVTGSGAGGICGPGVNGTSNGYNFVDDTSCGFNTATDRQGAGLNPQLAPLADNGAPGPTMLPILPSSPLIDAIPVASCQADGAFGITTDERGVTRPQVLGCDIGAVEVTPPPVPPVVITPTFTG